MKASINPMRLVDLGDVVGRRKIAEIARLATILTQRQRHRLRLLRKKGAPSFYKVPDYVVSYQALTRMNPETFAA